ncbi:MAG TPA: cation-transporting P-type ATPase, partial [Alphaproteobacteria bacterium]|nr:cation-transporting P-type ATPase [Alphaproteobacteria bacterium]
MTTAHNHNKAQSREGAGCCAPGGMAAADSGAYRFVFKVDGLDCAEEVAVLRRGVGPLVGGEDRLAFDVLSGRMMVLDGADKVSLEEVLKAVRRTGMSAVEWRKDDKDADRASDKRHRAQAWLTALSGLALLAGLAVHVRLAGGLTEALRLFAGRDGQPMPTAELAAYALAIGFGGRYVVVKAWYAAKSLRPDMNLLMVIAVTGAAVIGEWFEAA